MALEGVVESKNIIIKIYVSVIILKMEKSTQILTVVTDRLTEGLCVVDYRCAET